MTQANIRRLGNISLTQDLTARAWHKNGLATMAPCRICDAPDFLAVSDCHLLHSPAGYKVFHRGVAIAVARFRRRRGHGTCACHGCHCDPCSCVISGGFRWQCQVVLDDASRANGRHHWGKCCRPHPASEAPSTTRIDDWKVSHGVPTNLPSKGNTGRALLLLLAIALQAHLGCKLHIHNQFPTLVNLLPAVKSAHCTQMPRCVLLSTHQPAQLIVWAPPWLPEYTRAMKGIRWAHQYPHDPQLLKSATHHRQHEGFFPRNCLLNASRTACNLL
jgi:hypothetical protein